MDELRTMLLQSLRGGEAHDTLETVLKDFGSEDRGRIPAGGERSAWQILYHLAFSLRDILDFTKNEGGTYVSKSWPADYWPNAMSPEAGEWDEALAAYQEGIAEFEVLLSDRWHDLTVPFPWGEGQTLMREVLVAAAHSSYHVGQLVELKRWLAAGG